ncbi:hypothetical protein DFQ00_108189 [Paenibacillus barcinonensis]|uniref:Uncharacterized protein n=1 Tax=Paenibacillus barcinonensis TaxID=198119 RepID=A0A2V4WLU4_PAEBA|nr:hypothetical protein DFQ00_108189 [Paenibacillus barcinonensis]
MTRLGPKGPHFFMVKMGGLNHANEPKAYIQSFYCG